MYMIQHLLLRLKNAFLYKVGMKFPYSKIRVKAMIALGHEVGKDVYFPADLILTQNFVNNRGFLHLGDRVSIAPGCIFVLSSHANASEIRDCVAHKNSEIVIGHDSWIGAGSIILPGITIGECSIVGAGAVVTHDVEPYSIVVGNPAKFIRNIEHEHTN